MSKNILKIENLNLYYDDKQVLKNLNLNIEKNSITAISGPSGIGKSSLLLVLNQMIKEYENASFSGKVYFNDDNNGQVFIWNDDEESIPKENSLIKIEKIDKNVIYLSPIE